MPINRNNRKAEPIPVVPRTMKIVNPDGTVTRSGQLLLEQLQEFALAAAAQSTIIGYDINDATPGVNIGPMLRSPGAASVSRCVVVVKLSDPAVALSFDIRKNGTTVFSATPSIAAGAATGSVHTVGTLASEDIEEGDVFSIDVTSGSDQWSFTAQLEE